MADPSIELSYVTELSGTLIEYVKTLVVKREDLANKYESLQSAQNYDYYILAKTQTDSFESYGVYSDDILIQAGLTDAEFTAARINKMNIPETKRAIILQLQRAKILAEFVETNDYYRMLMGLPAVNDYLEIYITDIVPGVDNTKPIHLMTNDEISILRSLGYIDNLSNQYPTRPYIKYLGNRKIDLIFARSSKRFEIIRSGTIDNDKIRERFDLNYELSRRYILNNYYKKRLSIDQEFFDAYIAFIIMVNTLIMTVNDSIEIFNKKEYYNEMMVRQILQSNNLNIFDDIPLVYRKEIANNIKSLIVSKGTDEVIFKIFKIFGFSDITVKKFILVRDHKKDSNDAYVFSYDVNGNPIYNDMYDVSFAAIDIKSDNIDSEIRKPENKIAYTDVVLSDKYWGGYESDEEVRQALLKEDFNYIDTDYISIGTAYSLTELVTEMSYFFSTIFAMKNYIKKLTFIEPIYGYTIDVFYAMTMLAALISKKVGFNGDIVTDPANIAVIYKFNFDRTLTDITNILKRYNYNANANDYMIPILNSDVVDPSALVDLYFRDKQIFDKLVNIRQQTKNVNEYLAIKDLIDCLTKSKLSSDIFKKRDGTIATTYLDYLGDSNASIQTYIQDLPIDDIDNITFKILTSLEDYFRTDKFEYLFLKVPTLSGENSLKRYMLKVINTFKAFTINIFAMTITYGIDDRTNGNIKILDSVTYSGEQYYMNNIPFADVLGIYAEKTVRSDIKFRDELELIP